MDTHSSPPPNFREGQLEVGEGHTIWWRAHGDPHAPTVVVLHGGPGGATNIRQSEFFDPAHWQVVFFDQRGCGRSMPYASTRHNTTAHLVADMERLRESLGIERWALFGGSWGTRLALSYGIAHPQRCSGFLLRGVFLARREDIRWFLWDAGLVFPDAQAEFFDVIEDITAKRPASMQELLEITEPVLAPDHPQRQRLASAWEKYEWCMSSVEPMPARPTEGSEAQLAALRAVSMATLEHHYMSRVLPHEGNVLEQVGRIAHLPCEIVHGRYDMVCPIRQAWELTQKWPGTVLHVASQSGHWTFATQTAALLTAAAARLRLRL